MKTICIFLLALTIGSCSTMREQIELAGQKPQSFTVDLKSTQLNIGEIEAQFNKVFPSIGITKEVVKVTYFPIEDAVCLEYRYAGYTYYHFWSKAGREGFIKALNAYNEDYSARTLERRASRTKSVYGTVEGYVIWRMNSMSAPAFGNMDVELGYSFKDDSPFLTITQMPAIFVSPTRMSERDDQSPEIPMYLTRAQAEELIELFNPEFLYSLVPEILNAPVTERSQTIEADEY